MSILHNGNKVLNNITSVNEETMKEIAKEVYSTEEQVVGTWIDGKPIYRKVIDFGALPNSTLKQVPHGISDIDAIVSFNGVTFAKNKTATPIPYVYTDPINTVSLFLEGKNVCIQTFGDKTSYINTYVTLEYTKTTDA